MEISFPVLCLSGRALSVNGELSRMEAAEGAEEGPREQNLPSPGGGKGGRPLEAPERVRGA